MLIRVSWWQKPENHALRKGTDPVLQPVKLLKGWQSQVLHLMDLSSGRYLPGEGEIIWKIYLISLNRSG